MNKHKLRAECIYDVTQLLIHLPIIDNILIERSRFPDCSVTFTCDKTPEEILEQIKGMDGDVHVMYETLQPFDEYNATRVRNYF